MKLSGEQLLELKRNNPQLFNEVMRRLDGEAERNKTPPWQEALAYHQRGFVNSKAKRRVALCSRRAGKSHVIAVWLLLGGLESPNSLSVYVAQSRALARKILWSALQQLDREFDIGLHFGEIDSQLTITMPNGHQIWLAGCKDAGEIDKFRGPYYKRVVIDEAQSYGPWLKELVDEVFEPALLDLNGDIALTGTPCPIPAGLFYEASTGDGPIEKWETHSWTCINNPYIQRRTDDVTEEMLEDPNHQNPGAIEYLEKKLKDNNWTEDHPTYMREWRGMWIKDVGALVYPYDSRKNSYWKLPVDDEDNEWRTAIGLDVGYEDSTAWVIAKYRMDLPTIYIYEVHKEDKTIPSYVAMRTKAFMEQYNTNEVVIDAGGLGKGYQMEMAERYGVFAENAEKNKKRAFQESIKGELISGNIKYHPQRCSALLDEMSVLQWDETKEKESESFDNHCCDAMLYVYRSIINWYRPNVEYRPLTREEKLLKESSEHKKRTADRIKKRLRKKYKKGMWARDIAGY